MYNIKSLYTDYGEIIATFGEDKIESRITYFLDAINSFISAFNSEDITALEVNDKVLQFCIMDYFSDIYRLKEFHKIGKINDIKRVAYESYWILRRKPIQILSDDDSDDKIVFANEKFVLSYLTHEILMGNENKIMEKESLTLYKSFIESLFYHLKYRDCDAKVLELMMLAFKAGINYNTNK